MLTLSNFGATLDLDPSKTIRRSRIVALAFLFLAIANISPFVLTSLKFKGDIALEAPAVEAARSVARGEELYNFQKVVGPPFHAHLYTPLHSKFSSFFITNSIDDFLILRLLSLGFFVGWMVLLVLISKPKRIDIAVLIALILTGFGPFVGALAYARPDPMALFFSTAGFALVASSQWRAIQVIGGILLAIGVLTKQTSLPIMIGAIVACYFVKRPTRHLLLGSLLAVLATLWFFRNESLSGFFLSAVRFNFLSLQWSQTGTVIKELMLWPISVLVLVAGVVAAILPAKSNSGQRSTFLSIVYLASLSATLLTIGKPGSSVGYFIEPLGYGAALVASRLSGATVRVIQIKFVLGCLAVITATMFLYPYSRSFEGKAWDPRQIESHLELERQELQHLSLELSKPYSELNVFYFPWYQSQAAVLGQPTLVNDTFLYLVLIDHLGLSTNPFRRYLESNAVDVLAIPHTSDHQSFMMIEQLAPTFEQLIGSRYKLHSKAGRFEYWTQHRDQAE